MKCKFFAIARHIWMRFNFLYNYHYYELQKCLIWINILHQSNVRKSHATRLKSMNKIPFIWWNNTYVISKGYNQINLRLSCDKIVFQSSKSSKGSECLFLFKGGWSLLIKRLSINVTLKSLLLLASMEKLSKPDEWLQNKWCWQMYK